MTNAVDGTIAERSKTHGDYARCAKFSQDIMRAFRACPNWSKFSDAQVESLQMIAMKLHRIALGDPDVEDHWHDIAGYARLVEVDLQSRKQSPISADKSVLVFGLSEKSVG